VIRAWDAQRACWPFRELAVLLSKRLKTVPAGDPTTGKKNKNKKSNKNTKDKGKDKDNSKDNSNDKDKDNKNKK